MRSLTRRGTSLLEVLVTLSLAAILLALVAPLLRHSARLARATMSALAAERDATATTALLLHDLDHAESLDVAVPAVATLEYSRPIGEGVACDVSGGAPVVRADSWRATRAAASGRDEMLVLVDLAPTTWQRRTIIAVGGAHCPDGATALLLAPDTPLPGALFVRVVEPVRLRQYASAAQAWLGLEHRWNGTTIQPFAGPVTTGAVQWLILGGVLRADFRAGSVSAGLLLPLE